MKRLLDRSPLAAQTRIVPLLAAVGVGVIVLGAIVLLLMPDRPGGTISWAGAKVNSAGAGLPLIVLGVVAVAVGVAREGDGNSTTSTTTEEVPIFEDKFSTPSDRRWSSNYDAAGSFTNEAFQLSLERGVGEANVHVTADSPPSDEDVRVSVKAHRIGGTATSGYGYGLFCRADGAGNMYTFTVWAHHAVITKRSASQGQDIATNAEVTAQAEGDPVKNLQAVCATIDGGRAVVLQFWVNGEMKLRKTDDDEPFTTGTFGLHAALPSHGQNTGDTLVVEFDDFKVTNPGEASSLT
jgi:hypothetical protein